MAWEFAVSFVTVAPDGLTTAASDLANLGSIINQANAAAAGSTTQILVAGQDEVSGAIAGLFGAYAQQYQALSSEAAAVHEQFVQALTGSSASYAVTEAANASTAQALLNAAYTNLTDANQVLSQVDVNNQFGVFFDIEQNVADQMMVQNDALEVVASVESAEDVISAHAGPFSGLVNDLFTPLNLGWYQASENELNAAQLLDDAVAADSFSGPNEQALFTALIGFEAADLEFLGLDIISIPVETIASPLPLLNLL